MEIMELEEAVNQGGNKCPFFPIALSVAEEKAKEDCSENKALPELETAITEVAADSLSVNTEKTKPNRAKEISANSYSLPLLGSELLVYGSRPASAKNEIEENNTTNRSELIEEHYMAVTAPVEAKTEILQVTEAEELMRKMQYAFLLAANTSINNDDLRKMNLWIMQNPAYFLLFERNSLTKDVNYR